MGWLRRLFAVPDNAHAVPALDGVRALAASLVFLVHYQAAFRFLLVSNPPLYNAGEYAALVGFHGVYVFFVLSGFLIYGSLIARPVRPTRYLWRRVQRIYPTFLVVLAVYLVIGAFAPVRSKLPSGVNGLRLIAANVLLLPGVFRIRPIITVSWSLSFELVFYVLILAVVVALGLRRWDSRGRVLLWTGLLVLWLAGGTAAIRVVRDFIMFLPGILLAEAARSERARALVALVPVWLAALLAGSAIAAQPLFIAWGAVPGARVLWLAPTVVALLLLSATTSLLLFRLLQGPRTATIFAHEPLRRLGVVSYSFYLSHGLVIHVIAGLCARTAVLRALHAVGPGAYVLLFAPAFAAAVVAAFVLFRAVEEPLSLRALAAARSG
ncbi:hypothetical protein tb265_31390 [Gemmatimonadetes bacterium T265]|nr:hypothetical protein tb265_31390 [Gemmatimonadetes bacterium T265]